MAEYVTVTKELQRMCFKNRCAECPITKHRHECVNCYAWMGNHPEEVERIVMEWSAEHPIVTNGKKFEEVFGRGLEAVWAFNSAQFTEWMNSEYEGGGHDERYD